MVPVLQNGQKSENGGAAGHHLRTHPLHRAPMFSLNYKIGVEDDPKSYEDAQPENDPTNQVGVHFNVIQIKRKA